MISRRLAWIVLLSLSPWVMATAAPGQADDEFEFEVPLADYGVTLILPELEEIKAVGDPSEQLRGSWTGTFGDCTITILVWMLPSEQFRFEEPIDVADVIALNYRNQNRPGGSPTFAFTETRYVAGEVGFVPYACIAKAVQRTPGSTKDAGSLHFLTTILEKFGCCVEVQSQPPAGPDEEALILEFLEEGFKYEGALRNAQWEEEDANARWAEHAPKSAQGRNFDKPLRTKHYIILTNSSGGKSFAKKMEENYKKIRKIYPFEEVDNRKLMPVFLFRTNDQYYDYCTSVAGWSKEKAKASKGHAWKDYYATWYESPNDPVHIHEATHQIFRNRLQLNGGGSWFQEGVAEYIETKKNDRNNVARLAKKGEHTPFREFMTLPSLLHSSKTDQRLGNRAGDNYKQAALLIEFLCESKWGKKKFQDFLHIMGNVPRGDVEKIDDALNKVYGVGIDELEVEFVNYCKKR